MSTALSGSKLGNRLILAAVIALAVIWIAPLVWVFALSFKPNEFLSVRTDVLFSPPFTLAVALVLLEWAWGRITVTLGSATPCSATPRWQDPAHALRTWVLPEFDMRLAIVRQRLSDAGTLQEKLASSA